MGRKYLGCCDEMEEFDMPFNRDNAAEPLLTLAHDYRLMLSDAEDVFYKTPIRFCPWCGKRLEGGDEG